MAVALGLLHQGGPLQSAHRQKTYGTLNRLCLMWERSSGWGFQGRLLIDADASTALLKHILLFS